MPLRLILTLIVTIVISAGLIAQAPKSQPPSQRGAAPQADANGFKVGDKVQINTAFGWVDGTITAISGNNYRVRAQTGTEVTKTYPSELHRIGPLTDRDRAVGLYELHDKVQVNVDGKWTDGEVIAIMGMQYQVQLPGNRAAWAGPENLRFVGTPKPAAAKAGVPPRPGLTSCAGKIEGRYSSTGGFGNFTVVFQSGKATVKAALGDDEVLECWMNGDKVYLHKPGDSPNQDMPIDINNDGSLQTPLGEIKKKGN
jgi:hypothetical protein